MIGIVSPVDRSETSAAACTLADFICSQGEQVRFFCPYGMVDDRIHPIWSRLAERVHLRQLRNQAHHLRACIWFKPLRSWVKTLKSRTKNILVFSPVGLQPGDIRFYHENFDLITFTGSICRDFLTTHARFEVGVELPIFCNKISYVSWDGGLELRTKSMDSEYRPARYLFLCSSYSIDEYPTSVIQTIHWLLINEPACEVRLLALKSWNRQDRRLLSELKRDFSQFEIENHVGLMDQCRVFSEADWCVCPDLQSNYGIFILRSLACGTPVIAYRSEPVCDFVQHERNGLLIDGKGVTDSRSLSQCVEPNVSALRENLRYSRSSFLYKNITKSDFRRIKFFERMKSTWGRILDLGV